MGQNIRLALAEKRPYFEICREERNLCAILYRLLLEKDNLESLLRLLNTGWVSTLGTEVYVEYSCLRDIWNVSSDGTAKRHWLLDTLGYPNGDDLRTASIASFNQFFGATPKASEKYIQSPATWSMVRYDSNVSDNELFNNVTRLKWAFKAKPDVVIVLPGDRALCIETKLKSAEGRYPSSGSERVIFKRRDLNLVGQTEIQRVIFDLLGMEAEFRYVVEKIDRKVKNDVWTWEQIFQVMNLSHLPPFAKKWCARYAPSNQPRTDHDSF